METSVWAGFLFQSLEYLAINKMMLGRSDES